MNLTPDSRALSPFTIHSSVKWTDVVGTGGLKKSGRMIFHNTFLSDFPSPGYPLLLAVILTAKLDWLLSPLPQKITIT